MTAIEEWADDFLSALRRADDLDYAIRAVIREKCIRQGMAASGEDRRTVEDFLDAAISMDQEAVLALTDGEPTTLEAGLQRYVEELEEGDGRVSDPVELGPYAMGIVDQLRSLLVYPWPGQGTAETSPVAAMLQELYVSGRHDRRTLEAVTRQLNPDWLPFVFRS